MSNDSVTITCPVCQRPFTPQGKRRWCSEGCRVAAWRRRRQQAGPAITLPPARPRRPITVTSATAAPPAPWDSNAATNAAPSCAKLQLGGPCPHCDEPVAVTELLDQEVTVTN